MKTLEAIKKELGEYEGKNIKIMEVCGTHTSSILRTGSEALSPSYTAYFGTGLPCMRDGLILH